MTKRIRYDADTILELYDAVGPGMFHVIRGYAAAQGWDAERMLDELDIAVRAAAKERGIPLL